MTTMKLTKKRLLFEAFPSLYALAKRRGSLMEHGFCCGDGWCDIIWRLSAELEPMVAEMERMLGDGATIPRAAQVCERDGELVFDIHPKEMVTPAMRDAISRAENEAIITCELCGATAAYRIHHNGAHTFCDSCASK